MFACSVIYSHRTLAPTRQIFIKFHAGGHLLKFFDQFEVWLQSDKVTGTLCKALKTFMPLVFIMEMGYVLCEVQV
jgi:hypothetical protein